MRHFLALAVLMPVFMLCACTQSSFDDQCKEQAADFTAKHCPQKISEGVVLDSMVYSKAVKCVSYYFTLSGKIDDAGFLQANKALLREQLIGQIRNSVELKKVKDHKVLFRYVYLSETDGRTLTTVTISPSDYMERGSAK